MNIANDSLSLTSTSILAPPTGVSTDPDVRAFQALFPSSELAHTIGFPGSTPAFGQKAEWIYTTVRKPYAETDVQDHFAGRRSIVAIPILKDSTCHWGAIDIDVYGVLTLDALQLKCNALDLPLYCFPSKSGGAHLFAFFETAQTAARARQFLAFCTKKLGFPEAEIFPKQDVRPRVGNAINLPFFGSPDGLDEFSPRRCDPSQFELPALDEVKAGKDDEQMGIPLKEGWDPLEGLQEAGLLFSTRIDGEKIHLDYHSEMGLCLLQGSAHEVQRQNNRQSCFVYNPKTHRLWHWCFDSDCREKQNKTRSALEALGIKIAEIEDTEARNKPHFGSQQADVKQEAEHISAKLLSHAGLKAQREAAGSMPEIIEGLLPDKTVNIIADDSGLGKSPLMVQMAICAAFGIPFLGRETRRGRVLIVDYENPDILDRLNDIGDYLNVPSPMDEAWLRVIQNPTQKEVLAAIEHFHPLLVVVDGLRGYDSRMEKNLDGAAAEVLNRCQVAAMTHGLAWMFIHNVRKASEDFKVDLFDPSIRVMEWLETVAGSRALINQTFVRIGIEQVKKVKGEEVLGIRGFYKGRGEFGPVKIGRKFDDNGQPIGYYLVRGESLLSEDDRIHVARLPVGEELSFSQVKNLAEFKSDQPVSDFLKRCEAAGVITVQGKAKSKRRRYMVAAAITGADPFHPTAEDLEFL